MMNPAQFIGCCVFAVVCFGTMSSMSTHQSKVETERVMKETIRTAAREEVYLERKLTEGMAAVHWIATLQYPGPERNLSAIICDDGKSNLPHIMLRAGRVVGKSFMKSYAAHYNMLPTDLPWRFELPNDEDALALHAEAAAANAGKAVKKGSSVGYVAFSNHCPFCNPRNVIHPEEPPESHPAFLSGMLTNILRSMIQIHCMADLEDINFVMNEESDG